MLYNLIAVVGMVIVICLIITIHELGHYGIARLFRTRIDRFSLGFGKILLKRVDRHGTEWCLSAIPLGGYVKFAGDDNITSNVPDAASLEMARLEIVSQYGPGAEKDFFHFKPLWQRALIILAGPAMNFVLAFVVFTLYAASFGVGVSEPYVGHIAPQSIAERAGFRTGDHIIAINGHPVESFKQIPSLIHEGESRELQFIIDRSGNRLGLIVLRPKSEAVLGFALQNWRLGITPDEVHISRKRLGPLESPEWGVDMVGAILSTSFEYLGQLFTGKAGLDQVSGILGMTSVAAKVTTATAALNVSITEKITKIIEFFVMFAGFISVGVGFVNLLPIPVLDGGHLLFYGYEAVAQKPVSPQFADFSFKFGLVAIIGLMMFAAFNDVMHFGWIQSMASKVPGGH